MTKSPGIGATYRRGFTLYFKSFLNVLPFVLIMVVFQFFSKEYLDPLIDFFVALFIGLLIYVYLFYGIYTIHHNQFHFLDTLKEGSKRIFSYFFSLFILFLPLLAMLAIMIVTEELLGDLNSELRRNSHFLMGTLGLVYIFYTIYFMVSPVLIIPQRLDAISGLKRSWQLTQKHWWRTLAIFSIYALIVILIGYLLAILIPITQFALLQAILTILSAPLFVSLIVIHCEHLEGAHNGLVLNKTE